MCGMMLTSCGNDPADEEAWYVEKIRKESTDYYPWSDYSEEQDGSKVFFSDSLVWTFTKGVTKGTVEVKKLDGSTVTGTYEMQTSESAVLDQYVVVDLNNGKHYEGYCRWYTVGNGFYVFMLECDQYSIWLTTSNGYSYADYQQMLADQSAAEESEEGSADESADLSAEQTSSSLEE
jgi:hypothetical protein